MLDEMTKAGVVGRRGGIGGEGEETAEVGKGGGDREVRGVGTEAWISSSVEVLVDDVLLLVDVSIVRLGEVECGAKVC